MESKITTTSLGTKRWYNSQGQLHREGGPAIIWYDGRCVWYQHGKVHREDGPAVVYNRESRGWYLFDHRISFIEWSETLGLSPKARLEMAMKWNLQSIFIAIELASD